MLLARLIYACFVGTASAASLATLGAEQQCCSPVLLPDGVGMTYVKRATDVLPMYW